MFYLNWWCSLGESTQSDTFHPSWEQSRVTRAVDVVILVPPLAPTTKTTSQSWLITMLGDMEDRGLLPGWMKLTGDGSTPKSFVMFGEEKSSIWSLKTIPVDGDITSDPKERLIVLVTDTAFPSNKYQSKMLRCDQILIDTHLDQQQRDEQFHDHQHCRKLLHSSLDHC